MVASKFLNPKNDIAFKKIFGNEKNKDILIHFLNDMLVFSDKKPIKTVSFISTNQDPDIAIQKTSIVDVLCSDENGTQYIVQMQIAREKGFEKRVIYYASKTYSSQLKATKKYHKLKEVIFLAIADFIMFPEKKKGKSDYVILDKDTYENDFKEFYFTFLELPKFKQNVDQLQTMTEKWAYFFNHAEGMTSEELSMSGLLNCPAIERAYNELNQFSWNEDELKKYEAMKKIHMDNETVLDQKFDEGLEQGIKKGMEEGIKIVAQRLLVKGLSFEEISNITGLSIETIKFLR